jgi:predicted NUDIX family NTP pyrophosphohydrolase
MAQADLDLARFRSNTFEMEWPPRSGRTIQAPECDRAEYFPTDEALARILPGQRAFIEEAAARLVARAGRPTPADPPRQD